MNDPAMPVTFVPAEIEPTKRFYGIGNWPTDIGHVDLGNRVIDVLPIPGHSAVSVAFYDRSTGVLLAGDSLYPGRLYIRDFPAFQASIERLIQFTRDKPVAHILGDHIEETNTHYMDYSVGTIYQPDEHELALSRGALLELEDALSSMHGNPERLALLDFTIWPAGPKFTVPGEKERFKEHPKAEKQKMWDHSPQ